MFTTPMRLEADAGPALQLHGTEQGAAGFSFPESLNGVFPSREVLASRSGVFPSLGIVCSPGVFRSRTPRCFRARLVFFRP